MKFRSTLRDSPEITLTPLIDVVFLLLIFFMVSTTFERRSDLGIELPEAGAEADAREEAVIDVVLDAGGSVTVDGEALADTRGDALRQALADAAKRLGRTPRVVVSADARTPHQSVITVLDAARQAGLHRLTFAAQRAAQRAAEPGS